MPYKLPVVISGIKYPNEKLISKLPNVCGYTSKIDFVHLLKMHVVYFPIVQKLFVFRTVVF